MPLAWFVLEDPVYEWLSPYLGEGFDHGRRLDPYGDPMLLTRDELPLLEENLLRAVEALEGASEQLGPGVPPLRRVNVLKDALAVLGMVRRCRQKGMVLWADGD